MCHLPNGVINMGLPLAWNPPDDNKSVVQIFMVREPLARALSVYYFWGELFKLKNSIKKSKNLKGKVRLGKLENNQKSEPISRLFLYHGDEKTPPQENIAISYAKSLPYNKGMPGK